MPVLSSLLRKNLRALRLSMAAVSVMLLAAGGFLLFHRTPVRRTLRIGFQNSQPYHFPDAQNRPTGPAVEIIQVAARDRGLRLEWIFSAEGPERSLSSGTVDLWPLIADLQERHQFL